MSDVPLNQELGPDSRQEHGRRNAIRILVVLIVAIAVLSVLLLPATQRKSRPLADTVTISFLAYTNDSSKTRWALFKVGNPSPIAVELHRFHNVQIETATGWTSQLMPPIPQMVVLPNQTGLFKIAAPVPKQRWKVWLNYQDYGGLAGTCLLGLKQLGLPISYQPQTYSASSSPIDP